MFLKSKVSIIMPMYNVENYIENALNSVKAQRFENFEVIIVDDGSTDHSKEVACRIIENDSRFIIVSTLNMGQSHARNVGLEHATGEFISFLDPDDSFENDFLRVAIDNFDEATKVVSFLFPGAVRPDKNEIVSTDKFIDAMFFGTVGTVVWNKVFRREVLKNIKFPEGEVHEEIEFWRQVLPLVKNWKIINKSLYNYRVVRIGNTNTTFNTERLAVVPRQIQLIKWTRKQGYMLGYTALVINLLLFIRNYDVQLRGTRLSRKDYFHQTAMFYYNETFHRFFNVKMVFAHKKSGFTILQYRIKTIFGK